MEDLEERERGQQVHVVVVPCPVQGHINPLLQFSKHLAHRGLKVTLPTIFTNTPNLPSNHSLTIDQVHLLPYDGPEPENPESYWQRRQASIRLHLNCLISRHETSAAPVACVVYDSIIPWVLEFAKEMRVLAAPFFTQSCAVNAVYYNVHKGWLHVPFQQVSLDGLPVLHSSDLPSFVVDQVNYPSVLPFMTDQFSRLNEVDWIFVNTFDLLEQQETEWMEKQYPFKNIGPMVPCMYLNEQLADDKEYGLSLFETNVESTLHWLDSKESGSLVYVSFGSTAELTKEQMEELAWGLKLSNRFFLWVVRESEIHKLPINFIEETLEKGMVVKWCPQMEALAHNSVGCFVTHCGWNSILEALSLGVVLVAMPQWTDQPTNAMYVEHVWKIGTRVKIQEEDGIAKRDQIQLSIDEVMNKENSKYIRQNLRKWKQLAKEAMGKDGSSHNNINEFVQTLKTRV